MGYTAKNEGPSLQPVPVTVGGKVIVARPPDGAVKDPVVNEALLTGGLLASFTSTAPLSVLLPLGVKNPPITRSLPLRSTPAAVKAYVLKQLSA